MRAECALRRHNVLPQGQDRDGALVVAALNERAAVPLAWQNAGASNKPSKQTIQTAQTTQITQTTQLQSRSPATSAGQFHGASLSQYSAAVSDDTARICLKLAVCRRVDLVQQKARDKVATTTPSAG